MMGLVIFVHVVACVTLITIVLVQRGKGGGLLESFSNLETMFGTKTSAFLTRATTVCSIIFFITCLTLTFLSVRRSKSLMQGVKSKPVQQDAVKTDLKTENKTSPVESAVKKEEPVKQSTKTDATKVVAPEAKEAVKQEVKKEAANLTDKAAAAVDNAAAKTEQPQQPKP